MNVENPYSPPQGGMGSYPMPGAPTAPMAGVGPTELSIEFLRQTRPWVLFLSVMSFIGSAFMFLGGIGMFFLGALGPKGSGGMGGMMSGALLGAIYLPMGFLYLYPAIKMWQYGSSIGRLVSNRTNEDLEQALSHQKSFWKYCGIVLIVMMVLYVLLIVGGVVAAMAAASSMRH